MKAEFFFERTMKAEFNLTVPSFFVHSVLAASESSDVDILGPFAMN